MGRAGHNAAIMLSSRLRRESVKQTAENRFVCRRGVSFLVYTVLTALVCIGNAAGADTPSNPVIVRGSYIDDTHIKLTLSGFCQLPAGETPFEQWADFAGVWFQAGEPSATPDTTVGNYVRFDLDKLQDTAGCPATTAIDTVLEVPALSAPDSVYHLRVSVVWRNPDTVLSFDAANGDSVLMRDVDPPANPCSIAGIYAGARSDTAYLDITGLDSLESTVADVVVLCGFDPAFADTFFVRALDVDSLIASGTGDSLRLTVTSGAFDGARRIVYCAVVVVSDGGIAGPANSGSFEVGRDLPPNPIVLSATALSSHAVRLSWPFISVSGADSVRIFRDTAQIPFDIVDVVTPFDMIRVAPGSTEATVSDLSSSTTYYFAAQVRIYGDWTAVSVDGSAQARTFDPDTGDTVPNTAVVDAARFDSVHNRIVVSWHYEAALDSTIEFGYVYGVDSAAAVAGMPGTWHPTTSQDSAVIEPGPAILFDTTYTVVIRMRARGGPASRPSDNAIASVRVERYTWQPIEYFDEPTADTVWVFNKRIALWYDGHWAAGHIEDTVHAMQFAGAPQGLAPVGPFFRFSRYEHGPPLTLAVKYDSFPSGYRPEDIRLYRRTLEGQWMVFHDHELMADRGMVAVKVRMVDIDKQPLALMVDREPPATELRSNVDLAVPPTTELYDTIAVSDNIANLAVTLLYSRAANEPSPGLLDTLQGKSAVITTSIPGGYVTEEDGVRAYVVVSDGLHRDTINISRQVMRQHASDITTESGKWVPLRTSAVLEDSTVGSVIEGIVGERTYDTEQCRIFRWFDPYAVTDNAAGPHRWVEYEPLKEEVFSLTPGKLMWIKTRALERLDFGRGVTVSLKEPVTISLPPRNWTDVALPYKFGICLGDILDATGTAGESLQYYRWSRGDDGTYVTDAMYISSIPDSALNERSQVLTAGIQDGYSIYNPLGEAVVLRIPPVAQSISSYKGSAHKLAQAREHDSWALRVVARLEGAHRLGTVVLGYEPACLAGRKSWYPASQSFGGVSVRAWNRLNGTAHGHVVAHGPVNGGTRFDVLFENKTDRNVTITWYIDGLTGLPDTMAVRIVDPATGGEWPGDASMRVQVPAGGSAMRALAVGGHSYFADAFADVTPFAGFAAYPNPFSRGIAVRFLLPEGVGRLECRLYDTRGRLVWRKTEVDGIRVGSNVVVWNGRTGRARAAATGTYVLRAWAYDSQGALLATREQRLVRTR